MKQFKFEYIVVAIMLIVFAVLFGNVEAGSAPGTQPQSPPEWNHLDIPEGYIGQVDCVLGMPQAFAIYNNLAFIGCEGLLQAPESRTLGPDSNPGVSSPVVTLIVQPSHLASVRCNLGVPFIISDPYPPQFGPTLIGCWSMFYHERAQPLTQYWYLLEYGNGYVICPTELEFEQVAGNAGYLECNGG